MAHSLISTGLLEVISNRHAGNAKRLGKPPFPDVHTYFHGHEAGLSCWTSRMAEQRLGGCTAEAEVVPALLSQVMYYYEPVPTNEEAQAT